MKAINFDNYIWQVGKSRYGNEYQIEIPEKITNISSYIYENKSKFLDLQKKLKQYRKKNIINFTPENLKEKKEKKEKYNDKPVYSYYNKALIGVIKKNEQELKLRNQLPQILKV